MSNDFWKKWTEANNTERIKLVEGLPLYANKQICCPLFSPTIINNYFEELYIFAKGVSEDG